MMTTSGMSRLDALQRLAGRAAEDDVDVWVSQAGGQATDRRGRGGDHQDAHALHHVMAATLTSV